MNKLNPQDRDFIERTLNDTAPPEPIEGRPNGRGWLVLFGFIMGICTGYALTIQFLR